MTRLRQVLWHHRSDVLALATIVGAIAVYFRSWLTLTNTFYQVDIAFMDHPVRFHAFRLLRQGYFPFWTDGVLAGFPLFAEGQAALLYPPSWLYCFLPPEMALNAFVILHFLMLAAFSYLFLRSRALPPPGALFGTCSLVFSSFMLVEHVLPCFLAVVSWLPLLLWLCERQLRDRKLGHGICAAFVVALMHLAGDPLGTLLSVVLAAAFSAIAVEDDRPDRWRRRLVAVLLPVVLGTVLAGVQLLPTLEFLQQSTRRLGAAISEERFVPLEFLLTAFYPNFFGDSFARYTGGARQVWEESLLFFVGWAPLLLVPFGVMRRRERVFWLVLAGIAVLISSRSGFVVVRHLWSLPLLGLFRWPGRAVLWYALGVSVLSAYGFDALLRRSSPIPAAQLRQRCLVTLAVAASAIALLFVFRTSFAGPEPSAPALDAILRTRDQDGLWFSANWLLLLTAICLWRRRLIGRTAVAVLLFASLACGVLVGQKPEGVGPEVYRTEPETARFLKRRYGLDVRILALAAWSQPSYPTDSESLRLRAAALPANLHLRYDLRAAGQFDLESTTTLARNRALLAQPTRPILDLLGIDALVAPWSSRDLELLTRPRADPAARAAQDDFRLCLEGDARVYCRGRRLPRAFLVDEYRVLPTPDASAAFIRSASPDLRRVVLLERQPTWGHAHATAHANRERVEFRRDEPGRVELEVEAGRGALLVLADSYYPGWIALVDGRPAEILAADGFVRAVAVPEGIHHVTFRYRADVFWLGLAVSLAGLLLAVVMVLRGRSS